ncbi:MAG TPA: glycosyltransferase family 4 protein [Anaeromyxobacter sp.]|nr:glycosyltransferase family 4 protein [Anaeromyxobacter sp.]
MPFPASPATIGAQRRMEGLMIALARRHSVSAVSLVDSSTDATAAGQAMRAYCRELVLVPTQWRSKLAVRLHQLRLLLARPSLERYLWTTPEMQRQLDRLLLVTSYDAVFVEFPFLAHYSVRHAQAGRPLPRVLVDEHNIEHDLSRRQAAVSHGVLRKLHYAVNWRKVRREEIDAWNRADGVLFTSGEDLSRAIALCPSIRAKVVPNGVDLQYFRPRPEHRKPDGRSIVFFGTLDYFPNQDGMLHFLAVTWPLLQRTHPEARLKVIGPRPTPEVLRHRGPRVEVTGMVEDLRPHLAEAAAIIVPLRVGGGTRLKILEAMAMGRPIVSTTVGAEGIVAVPGQDILIADDPGTFASEVGRLLESPELGARIGASARSLVERRYSWGSVADELERFLVELRDSPTPVRDL